MKFLIILLIPLITYADIVVKSSKLKTTQSKMTNDVTIITQEEIENSDASTLQELLQSKAGIYIDQTGAHGSVSSLRFRGLPTGFSKIIVDDIEMVDPTDISNSFQLNTLSLSNIESIEILKGSQSILYGSSAIGGVIRVNTKTSNEKSIRLEYGSHNTINASANINKKTNKYQLGTSYSYTSTDGISAVNEDRVTNAETDSFAQHNVGVNLKYFLNDSTDLLLQTQYINSEVEIDGYNPAPPYNPIDVVDGDLSTYEQIATLIGSRFYLMDGKLEIFPNFKYSSIERNDELSSLDFEGNESDLKVDSTYRINDKSKALLGFEYLKQEDESQDTYSELLSAYISYNTTSGDFFYDIGARSDTFTSFNSNLVASGGIGYNINKNMILKAHISQGFKLPTLFQLANQLDNLDPTDSVNSEASLVLSKPSYKLTLSAYHYDLKNQIDFDTVSGKYFNISESRIQGVELSGGYDISRDFNISTSITFQDAKNEKTNTTLAKTPEELISLDLLYKTNKFGQFKNTWQYIGEREDQGTLPSYVIGHLNYKYKNWNFKIINILDKDYENVRYYGTLPRSYYLGYKYSL